MATFIPPTYRKAVRRIEGALWANVNQGISVVRVGGVFTSIETPTGDQLSAAGVEGVDWFIGGHEYTVSSAIAAELTAAGYAVS